MGHSVQNHLGMQADDYDRVIRTFIPGYERMLATIHHWLEQTIPRDGRVIDLGGGTGALAHSVLSRLPGVHVEVWDIDPQMLAVARTRLSQFGDRVTFVERSFTSELPACNAVVASLSLHHIPDRAAKRAVFSNIFAALSTPGIFLNGDAAVALAGPGGAGFQRQWGDFMKTHGMTDTEVAAHFASWAQEDTYFPLFDELRALHDVGFAQPDCFWKEGPIAVYGGIKPAL